MMRRLALLAIGLSSCVLAQGVSKTVEAPAENCRRLLIYIDIGELQIRVSDSTLIRGTVRHTPPAGRSPEDLQIITSVEGSTTLIRGVFGSLPPWPLQVEFEVPRGVGVSVRGDRLDVTARSIDSPLQVQTLAGNVLIEDSLGSTTAFTETGNITHVLRRQPTGDTQLQSDSGAIRTTLAADLNLHAVLRSGSILTWGTEIETMRGRLERSMGNGGPLVYAASGGNKVAVDIEARKAKETEAGSEVVFRSDTNWVYMNVVLKDPATDATITGLRRESFRVFDSNTPVEIRHFESTTAPFHLLLLFDVSESIRPHVSLIREAAMKFIGEARPGDEIAVATFSSSPRLVQGFTPDIRKVQDALKHLAPSGGTAVYDAVYTSIAEYMGGITGRKAIVLFTDGIDNNLLGGEAYGSRHGFDDLLVRVKGSECMIYPIFLQPIPQGRSRVAPGWQPNPGGTVDILAQATGQKAEVYCASAANPGLAGPCPFDPYQLMALAERHMRGLAVQTGGRTYTPRRIEDLSQSYIEVAGDLRHVYTLGFPVKPGKANEWHELKVRVREQPLATIRTRAGYFTPGK